MDRTFLLASPERGSAGWGYVTASRHRIDLQVYGAGADCLTLHDELARAWGRSQAKGLAIDRLRERELGRASERTVIRRDIEPPDRNLGWE